MLLVWLKTNIKFEAYARCSFRLEKIAIDKCRQLFKLSAVATSDNLNNCLHLKSKSINTLKIIEMPEFIKNSLLQTYYDNIESIFKKIKLFRKHLDVVFVFGSASSTSYRTKFLKYSESSGLSIFKFITIESLYEDILEFSSKHKGVSARKIELAKLEYEAINNAYSILLFPESFGSCAELGYFSFSEKSRDKIIVLNNNKYNNKDTYVNELIKFVHEEKHIDPYSFVDGLEEDTFFNCIDKLTYGYKDFEAYQNSVYVKKEDIDTEMYKLSILYELIKIFPYISQSELISLLRYVYKKEDISSEKIEKYVTSMISLLCVSNLIERKNISGSNFFTVVDENYNLFIYDEITEPEYRQLLLISANLKKARGIL